MQNVGKLPFTGRYFKLEPGLVQPTGELAPVRHRAEGGASMRFLAPDAHIRPSIETSPSAASLPKSAASSQIPASATASSWRRQEEVASAKAQAQAQAAIDSIVASNTSAPIRALPEQSGPKASQTASTSSRSTPEPGDKVYCSFWIRHGDCDYAQQGCRYKHEMPDKATLASIGFRNVPRWWQERVAVQLGQSAIPTVGPVMKSSEWIKRRSSNASDTSSESESDCESEAEQVTDEADKHEISAKVDAVAEQMNPAKLEKVATEASDKAVNISSKTSANLPATAVEGAGKLSFNGDLIDLSPISSDFKASCETSPPSCNPASITESILAPSKHSKLERKQSSSPRKVFVPAGESKGFHIADARKRAQEQEFKTNTSNSKESPFVFKSQPSQDRDTLKRKLPAKPPTILERADNDAGLMASIHATQPASSQPAPTKCSLADKKAASSSPNDRTQLLITPAPTKGTTLSRRQKYCQARAQGDKTATKSAEVNRGTQPARTTSLQDNKTKAVNVCRPRVPAGSAPKVERPKRNAKDEKH